MSAIPSTPISAGVRFTPEDLLRVPDNVSYELVDGNLVERNMGMESSKIALQIAILIGIYLEKTKLGLLFGADASYRCFPDAPDKVRKPDVSFIKSGRLPNDAPPKGHCTIPPDLAVEVVSPGDLAYEVDEKVAEYMKVGIPLVWVVNPQTRAVRVHRPRSSPLGSVSELSDSDVISGEEILTDFSCAVSKFFA